MAETIYERRDRRIRETRDDLRAQGRLLSVEELKQEHRSFAARFGPKRLSGLAGPELLNVLATRGGAESLPDWLESEGRADERSVFGWLRPSGGHCLGLWFDPDKKCWCRYVRGQEQVRGETPSVLLKPAEAVDMAEQWRTQLLAAARKIEGLNESGGDAAYLELQDHLETLAPDLVREGWAHKYLALSYPGRLDQFHDPDCQRYLLFKCSQIPPRLTGRRPPAYSSAGRFAHMARELRMPMNHLCLSLQTLFGSAHRYWLLRTDEKEWQKVSSQGFIGERWPLLGDLKVHSFGESLRWDEMVRERLCAHYPSAPLGPVLAHLRWLAREAHAGDLIVAHQGETVLGLARLTAPYNYEPGRDEAHRRPLEVIDAERWPLPVGEAGRTGISLLWRDGPLLIEIEKRLLEKGR